VKLVLFQYQNNIHQNLQTTVTYITASGN